LDSADRPALRNRPFWRGSSRIVCVIDLKRRRLIESTPLDFGSVVCAVDCPSLLLAFGTARY